MCFPKERTGTFGANLLTMGVGIGCLVDGALYLAT
jgi:hypothetical protein